MRIGLNILYLIPNHVGGTETYARELIASLVKKYPKVQFLLYTDISASTTFESFPNLQIISFPFYSSNRIIRILFEQIILPFRLILDRVDLVFSLGYSTPLVTLSSRILTIHDLNWHYHPEDFSLLNRLVWKYMTVLSAKSANYIITDSLASKKSLTHVLKLNPSFVASILHAAPTTVYLSQAKALARRRGLGIKHKYIMTTVAGYPHKNLITLLRSYKDIVKKFPKLQLVVCGLGGRASKQISDYLVSNHLESNVLILGYVDRIDLVSLYMGAEVFVFPSAYEGFGYPPLEAMQYKIPVVSSNAFSLSEVVGNGGVMVDAMDTNAYTLAITKLLTNHVYRQKLIRAGQNRLKSLSWEITAEKTMKVLRKAI